MKKYFILTICLLLAVLAPMFGSAERSYGKDNMYAVGAGVMPGINTRGMLSLYLDISDANHSDGRPFSGLVGGRTEFSIGEDMGYFRITATGGGGLSWTPGDGFFELQLAIGPEFGVAFGSMKEEGSDITELLPTDIGLSLWTNMNFYFSKSRMIGFQVSARTSACTDLLMMFGGDWVFRFYAGAYAGMIVNLR